MGVTEGIEQPGEKDTMSPGCLMLDLKEYINIFQLVKGWKIVNLVMAHNLCVVVMFVLVHFCAHWQNVVFAGA